VWQWQFGCVGMSVEKKVRVSNNGLLISYRFQEKNTTATQPLPLPHMHLIKHIHNSVNSGPILSIFGSSEPPLPATATASATATQLLPPSHCQLVTGTATRPLPLPHTDKHYHNSANNAPIPLIFAPFEPPLPPPATATATRPLPPTQRTARDTLPDPSRCRTRTGSIKDPSAEMS
jgi:hypothetical protein